MPKTIEIDFNDLSNLKTMRLISNTYRYMKASAFDKYVELKGEVKNNTIVDGNVVKADGIIVDDDTANYFAEEGVADGWLGPSHFAEAINSVEGDLTLFINSPGGNVFDAVKMVTALEQRATKSRVDLVVDGLSASAATYLLFAAGVDSRKMTKMSQIMIHRGWVVQRGNAPELTKTAQRLDAMDRSYADLMAEVMTADSKEILRMMSEETWFTTEEAIKAGLVSEVYTPVQPESEVDGETGGRLAALNEATRALLYDLN